MTDDVAHIGRSVDDLALRREVRGVLEGARDAIRGYTGFYSDEDLLEAVLSICNKVADPCLGNARIEEARALVEERCQQLVKAANRFADRDFEAIAAYRAQAVAAVDMLQDIVVDVRKAAAAARGFGSLLRRRAR
jgi:hypothetical protein